VTVILYVDGGTRGSVICLVDPHKKKTIVKTRRGDITNNGLEYLAMIYGIEYAKNNYPKDIVIIKSDSMVVVNQINGMWKVNAENLGKLYVKAIRKLRGSRIRPSWTPRENNLAGLHLDSLKDK